MLNDKLIEWQKILIEKYSIDMDTSRHKKQGIEGVVANITGVINEDWRYTKWEES